MGNQDVIANISTIVNGCATLYRRGAPASAVMALLLSWVAEEGRLTITHDNGQKEEVRVSDKYLWTSRMCNGGGLGPFGLLSRVQHVLPKILSYSSFCSPDVPAIPSRMSSDQVTALRSVETITSRGRPIEKLAARPECERAAMDKGDDTQYGEYFENIKKWTSAVRAHALGHSRCCRTDKRQPIQQHCDIGPYYRRCSRDGNYDHIISKFIPEQARELDEVRW